MINNPYCEIYDSSSTISNGYDNHLDEYFNGAIYGYENSTAQKYAEKYGYNFESIGQTPGKPIVTTPVVTTNAKTTITTTTTTVTTETTNSETTDTSNSTEKVDQGDANGDGIMNIRDAAFIAKMLAQGKADQLPESADYNGDGKVNIRDAAAIAKFLVTGK